MRCLFISILLVFTVVRTASLHFPDCIHVSQTEEKGKELHLAYRSSEAIIGFSDFSVYKRVELSKKEYIVREIFLNTPEALSQAQKDIQLRLKFAGASWQAEMLKCYEDPAKRILYTVFKPFGTLMETDPSAGGLATRLSVYRNAFKIMEDLAEEKVYFNRLPFGAFAYQIAEPTKNTAKVRLVDFTFLSPDSQQDPKKSTEINFSQKQVTNKHASEVQDMCLAISRNELNFDTFTQQYAPSENQYTGGIDMRGVFFEMDSRKVEIEMAKKAVLSKLGYGPKDPTNSIFAFILHCLTAETPKVLAPNALAEILDSLSSNLTKKKPQLFKFAFNMLI